MAVAFEEVMIQEEEENEWWQHEQEKEFEEAEVKLRTEMEISEFNLSGLMMLFELFELKELEEELAEILQAESEEYTRLTKKNRRAVRRQQKRLAQKRAESIYLQNRNFYQIVKEDGWRFTHGLQKYNFMGFDLEDHGIIRIHEYKPSKRRFFADIDSIDGHVFGTPTGVWKVRKLISKNTREDRGDIEGGFKHVGRRSISSASAAIRQGVRDMENEERELQKEFEALAFWDGQY